MSFFTISISARSDGSKGDLLLCSFVGIEYLVRYTRLEITITCKIWICDNSKKLYYISVRSVTFNYREKPNWTPPYAICTKTGRNLTAIWNFLKRLLYLGALGDECGDMCGEDEGDTFLGGTGGGRSRREELGDIRGDPFTGECFACERKTEYTVGGRQLILVEQ